MSIQKLTFIFMLCAFGLNVSAQQTALQHNIASKSVGDTIKADSKNWCIIKKTPLNGIDYVYLLSVDTQLGGPINFGSDNHYQGSSLQTNLNSYYNGSVSQLKAIAVVPDLGDLININNQTTSTPSKPTADLAVGSGKTNILFAPSYYDISNPFGTGGNAIGNLPKYFYNRFWTRTPSNTNIFEVNPSTKAMVANPLSGTTVEYAGGIWVRTTAINYQVSGTIKGLPNVLNQEISYSIDNGNPTPTYTNGSGKYTITVPHGSKVTITPPKIKGYSVFPNSQTMSDVKNSITVQDFIYYIPGFTVNGEDYLAIDGTSYCNTTNFSFSANLNTPAGDIVWKLIKESTVIQQSTNAAFSVYNLLEGFYTISLTTNGITCTTRFAVGSNSIVWTGAALDNDWHNPNNWTPAIVPTICNDVYIPGNLGYYPLLDDTDYGNGKIAECHNIYFIFGSELGRPDLLMYEKAFVQYNFGLWDKNNQQQKDPDINLVTKSKFTDNRLKYSAAVSATPIERERWYMLSAPLMNMVTGDLGFGGFPITFLKKFGPINKDNKNYPVGEWTNTYTSMKEPLANQITDGYAYFMYGLGNGSSDLGCYESGVFGQLNELDVMPFRGGGNKHYGLKETNGILELPSFADSLKLYAHRTQVYNGIDESTFHYFYGNAGNMISTSISPDLVNRDESNYRFAPEKYGYFETTIMHDISDIGDEQEFLVGNPYMSSIDMISFFDDNIGILAKSFRIWNGKDFISCKVIWDGTVQTADPHEDLDMRYISPLQGFLLKTAPSPTSPSPAFRSGTEFIEFNVENISVVRPNGTDFNLRSSAENRENNLLRIKAENSSAASYAVIKSFEGASNNYVSDEDVQKLFSPLGYVPSIYSLAGETPVDINFINDRGDIIVPLGIKTDRTGEIRLTFTGMDNYKKATKIELIDALENRTVDLTGKSSYTYIFDHKEKGIQNGRFSLRISSSISELPNVEIPNDLEIYGDSRGIYVISSESVKKLEVFDFTGKKLYENNSETKYFPLPDNLSKSPMIVKVVTKSMVKTVKIN